MFWNKQKKSDIGGIKITLKKIMNDLKDLRPDYYSNKTDGEGRLLLDNLDKIDSSIAHTQAALNKLENIKF